MRIPYNELENIEEIGRGGFSTTFKASWKDGFKYMDNNNEQCIENRVVVLKRLHNSRNISNEFLIENNSLFGF